MRWSIPTWMPWPVRSTSGAPVRRPRVVRVVRETGSRDLELVGVELALDEELRETRLLPGVEPRCARQLRVQERVVVDPREARVVAQPQQVELAEAAVEPDARDRVVRVELVQVEVCRARVRSRQARRPFVLLEQARPALHRPHGAHVVLVREVARGCEAHVAVVLEAARERDPPRRVADLGAERARGLARPRAVGIDRADARQRGVRAVGLAVRVPRERRVVGRHRLDGLRIGRASTLEGERRLARLAVLQQHEAGVEIELGGLARVAARRLQQRAGRLVVLEVVVRDGRQQRDVLEAGLGRLRALERRHGVLVAGEVDQAVAAQAEHLGRFARAVRRGVGERDHLVAAPRVREPLGAQQQHRRAVALGIGAGRRFRRLCRCGSGEQQRARGRGDRGDEGAKRAHGSVAPASSDVSEAHEPGDRHRGSRRLRHEERVHRQDRRAVLRRLEPDDVARDLVLEREAHGGC